MANCMTRRSIIATLAVFALANSEVLLAQHVATSHAHRPWTSNVVIPQSRAFSVRRQATVQIIGVNVGVVIVEQVATTTMDIELQNPASSRLEAELVVPVPDGAVVRSFDFQGAAEEPSAQLLPQEEARRMYDSIVAKVRDPALLEFIGYNLIRSSVFPVEAKGAQKVRLTYETILAADGDRVDYVLPRSESLDYHVPWHVSVRIKSKRPIATVYSPSHQLETLPGPNDKIVSARIPKEARTEPGSFRLSYLLQSDGVTASLLAYPESADGGYFLLLAGLPPHNKDRRDGLTMRREVTLVLDRSGSMNGEKLQQVRKAARQIVAGLDDGEAFNIIVYNEAVESFAPRPVLKDTRSEAAALAYLNSIKARGGTNIHDALLESLRPKPTDGMLPMVLFLTDGRPTIGQTGENVIRALATSANVYRRRIFTFGVGVDVNSPLLENLAYRSRAAVTFVLPGEDVELKVAGVFKRLSGPVLADPKLRVLGSNGKPAMGRVSEVMPAELPDLFEGDQLVLLGRYVGRKPVTFALSGNYLGKKRTFKFKSDFDKATTSNAFVSRLWAGRKIGMLVDAIRSSGANPSAAENDPKFKELVDEIVRLSTEFGILTEYTAFLAREGTDLSRKDSVLAEATGNFRRRAIQARVGTAAVNQDLNSIAQKAQSFGNRRNEFYDAKLNRVAITNVQQVADLAFYRKGNIWIDSRLADKNKNEQQPAREIEFGSEQFMQLARKLAAKGRQGSVAFDRDTLLLVDGHRVLIKAPKP